MKSGPWYVHCFTSALRLDLQSSILLHTARSEIIDQLAIMIKIVLLMKITMF